MASPVIRARMQAIIAACDALLPRVVDQEQIKQVAQVRADAIARLEG